MPFCRKCGLEKNEEEFSWRWKALGIRQPVCKSCRREENAQWYERHHEEHRGRVRDRMADARQAARDFVWNYLSYSRCANCGEYDPMVLQFHHVRGKKKKDISRMVAEGASIDAIMEEIKKCEVVCANCHQRKEITKRGKPRW